jgi:hypothetical protein
LDKHFSKEDPKTASEHRKRCSVLRELEIKAIVRHCLTHIRRVGWLISCDFWGQRAPRYLVKHQFGVPVLLDGITR